MFVRVSDLYSFNIKAKDGEIGKIDDVLFDDEHWGVRYFVVDTGPLFFGRTVLLAPTSVREIVWDEQAVVVDLSVEQVKDSPDVDMAKPVSRQALEDLHDHYAWPVVWGRGHWNPPSGPIGMGGTAAAPVVEGQEEQIPEPVQEEQPGPEDWDPSLRSAKEVIGYAILTEDGPLGKIEDLLLSDENLSIRYIVADASGLFEERQVVLCVDWLHRFAWTENEAVFDLSEEQVRKAPPYDENEPFTEEDEERLCKHFDR